jgi:hypothetical protein
MKPAAAAGKHCNARTGNLTLAQDTCREIPIAPVRSTGPLTLNFPGCLVVAATPR